MRCARALLLGSSVVSTVTRSQNSNNRRPTQNAESQGMQLHINNNTHVFRKKICLVLVQQSARYRLPACACMDGPARVAVDPRAALSVLPACPSALVIPRFLWAFFRTTTPRKACLLSGRLVLPWFRVRDAFRALPTASSRRRLTPSGSSNSPIYVLYHTEDGRALLGTGPPYPRVSAGIA